MQINFPDFKLKLNLFLTEKRSYQILFLVIVTYSLMDFRLPPDYCGLNLPISIYLFFSSIYLIRYYISFNLNYFIIIVFN